MRPHHLIALTAIAGSCRAPITSSAEGRPPLDSAAVARRPPAYDISWGPSVSIYDLLGKDTAVLAKIMVPRRRGRANTSIRAGDYEIWTECTEAACVDGLREATSLEPVIGARVEGDEAASLVGDGSGWLERGLKVTSVTAATLSLRRGTAWWNGSSASSSASIACETYSRGGRWRMRLADAVGPEAATALLGAVRRFLREQREIDLLPSGLADLDSTSFTITADGVVFLCVEHAVGSSDGFAETIRAARR